MPTNYTGSELNTQAPAPRPEPQAVPIVALPADGDPPNASTFAQGLKYAADWIHWLMDPIAKAALTPRFLRRYRTRVGHTRWALDRIGLPAATYIHWQEHWPGSINFGGVTAITTVYGSAGPWQVTITGAGGAVNASLDILGTRVVIDGGDANGNESTITRGSLPELAANTDFALEATVSLENAASAAVEHVMGIALEMGGVDDPNATDGLRFLKTPGQANWRGSSKNGGVETNIDLGVAPVADTPTRLRVEFRGANVNDGGASAAYFFIDGTHRGTITTNLPPAAVASRTLVFGVRNTTGNSGAAERLRVYAVNVAHNWFPAVTT
jgi:hypothetical protein